MRPANQRAMDVDPLQDIEDILSSLCGKQSHRNESDQAADKEYFQRGLGLNKIQGITFKKGEVETDHMFQVREKSTSSKDTCPKRAPGRRQTRSNALKRNQNDNGIRKSSKSKNKLNENRRTSLNNVMPLNVNEDGVQAAEYPAGTSSDEGENMNFLNKMQRLAEDQLDVHKRKNDAINVKAINIMKQHTDQCTQKMKRIAGEVSSQIISGAAEIEQLLSKELSEQTGTAMKRVSVQKNAMSEITVHAKAFQDQLDQLVEDVYTQRIENKEKQDAEEMQVYANAKKFKQSSETFAAILQEIDAMIDAERFNGK